MNLVIAANEVLDGHAEVHVGHASSLLSTETLIYIKWYIDVSAPDMSFTLRTQPPSPDTETDSATYPALLQLSRPLLDYRIIIAIVKGDVGAVNILKDAVNISKDLPINNLLLALGPTTPLSLRPPQGSRILSATFVDGANLLNGPRLTIVPPNHLTDLSLNLDKLSKTRTGRIPLIVGDFLDNVLLVSTAPTGLNSFLCKLFTRIRTNMQTAFFLVTEEMHDSKKTAILKRFADVVIEYSAVQDLANHRLEARILDHVENHYSIWDSSESPDAPYESRPFLGKLVQKIGRQPNFLVEQPATIHL
jgi:hypothetical protein